MVTVRVGGDSLLVVTVRVGGDSLLVVTVRVGGHSLLVVTVRVGGGQPVGGHCQGRWGVVTFNRRKYLTTVFLRYLCARCLNADNIQRYLSTRCLNADNVSTLTNCRHT